MNDPNLEDLVVFREPTREELENAGLVDRGMLPSLSVTIPAAIVITCGILWYCMRPTPLQYSHVNPPTVTAQGGLSVNDTRGCEAVKPGGGLCKAPNGKMCSCDPNEKSYRPR